MLLQILLFTQSRQVGFVLPITKLKIKKKYIHLCDHRNSAIDIVAGTVSPVMITKYNFFRSALKTFPFDIIEKKFTRLQLIFLLRIDLILIFLSCQEVSGNRQKPKRNYMAVSVANNDRSSAKKILGITYDRTIFAQKTDFKRAERSFFLLISLFNFT